MGEPKEKRKTSLVIILAVISLGMLALWPIGLPLLFLTAYPCLALGGAWFTLCAIWSMATGMWKKEPWRIVRAVQQIGFAGGCLGLLALLVGIAMGIDSALAGAPPTFEEKARGRTIAYNGAAVAVGSLVVAYMMDLVGRKLAGKEPEKRLLADDLA